MTSPLFNAQRARLPFPEPLLVIAGQYVYLPISWTDAEDNPLDLEGHIFKLEIWQDGVKVVDHAEAPLGVGESTSEFLVPKESTASLVDGIGIVRISFEDADTPETLLFRDSVVIESD